MNRMSKQANGSLTKGQAVTEEYEAIGLIKNGVQMIVNIIMRYIIREVRRHTDADLGRMGQLPSAGDFKHLEQSEKLTYSVPEVSKLLGLSRNSVYEATRTRQIPSISFGKMIMIPRAALEKILGELGPTKYTGIPLFDEE